MLKLKRAYESPARGDGCRVLVERLWPRGVSRDQLAVDLWLKDVAPSTELRKWFGHAPDRWPEFRNRYRAELRQHEDALDRLRQLEREHRTLTLVYAARDEQHNGALVLRDYLEARRPHLSRR
jgi:uncharacterized protein YeaO (DUF488 family)